LQCVVSFLCLLELHFRLGLEEFWSAQTWAVKRSSLFEPYRVDLDATSRRICRSYRESRNKSDRKMFPYASFRSLEVKAEVEDEPNTLKCIFDSKPERSHPSSVARILSLENRLDLSAAFHDCRDSDLKRAAHCGSLL